MRSSLINILDEKKAEFALILPFEIITNMEENRGDFPGVTSLEYRQKFLNICPNPNLILGIDTLDNFF